MKKMEDYTENLVKRFIVFVDREGRDLWLGFYSAYNDDKLILHSGKFNKKLKVRSVHLRCLNDGFIILGPLDDDFANRECNYAKILDLKFQIMDIEPEWNRSY